MITLRVLKLDPRAKIPTVAHPGEDNAYDLYALEDYFIRAGQTVNLRTGIACTQDGYGFLVMTRSSLPAKGLHVRTSLVDSGYRGEWHVIATAPFSYQIRAGDKIGQALPVAVSTGQIIEILSPDEFSPSKRGGKGFGSSGR